MPRATITLSSHPWTPDVTPSGDGWSCVVEAPSARNERRVVCENALDPVCRGTSVLAWSLAVGTSACEAGPSGVGPVASCKGHAHLMDAPFGPCRDEDWTQGVTAWSCSATFDPWVQGFVACAVY